MKNEEQFNLLVKVVDEAWKNDKSPECYSIRQVIHMLCDFFAGKPLKLEGDRPDWKLFNKFAKEHSDEYSDISMWILEAKLPEEFMPVQDLEHISKSKINRILKRSKSGEFYYE